MKKQLVLTKTDNIYKLTDKNDEKKWIEIIDKVISGEKTYEAFYKNINETVDYEIETELSDPADVIICKQLKLLFEKIDKNVNENCFNYKGDIRNE